MDDVFEDKIGRPAGRSRRISPFDRPSKRAKDLRQQQGPLFLLTLVKERYRYRLPGER